MLLYDPAVFTLPEEVRERDTVVATYLLETEADVDVFTRTAAISIEQTTGTWVPVPEETPELRRRHVGKVVGIYEVPFYEDAAPSDQPRRFVVRIAYPQVNFGPDFPMLLTTVMGNISSLGRLKLLDLELPRSFTEAFPGPRFGIQGVRELLGVFDRPLLNNMIKPCTGFPPEVGAKLAYEVVAGGVDIVKDDELLADPPFNRIEDRVKAYMAALRRAYEETGQKALYTVNITGEPRQLLENARRALDAGANALMVNYVTAGLGALRMLAQDPEINVPILGHPDFAGALVASPWTGVSSLLLGGKLPRLAGADMVILLNPYGKFPILRDRYLQVAVAMTAPWQGIKPTLPMPAAGMHPGLVEVTLKDLGPDCVMSAGGGIHAHPMGPRAGARAMRQAIDAAVRGVPVEEAAREQPELKAALEKWGVWRPGKSGAYELRK